MHEKAGGVSNTWELPWPVRDDMKRLSTKPVWGRTWDEGLNEALHKTIFHQGEQLRPQRERRWLWPVVPPLGPGRWSLRAPRRSAARGATPLPGEIALLCAGRPSDALLQNSTQNGHGKAVGRRRRLEDDGTRQGDGHLGSKTRRRLGCQALRFLAQR